MISASDTHTTRCLLHCRCTSARGVAPSLNNFEFYDIDRINNNDALNNDKITTTAIATATATAKATAATATATATVTKTATATTFTTATATTTNYNSSSNSNNNKDTTTTTAKTTATTTTSRQRRTTATAKVFAAPPSRPPRLASPRLSCRLVSLDFQQPATRVSASDHEQDRASDLHDERHRFRGAPPRG